MSTTVTRGLRLARPKQTAAYLGCGVSTLWAWAAERPSFPKRIKVGERVTLFDLDQIDAFVLAGQTV